MKKILVVDDAPENIDLLTGLLKSKYGVMAARNGEIALKISQGANTPDLILLDIIMPGMDGFEVCRQLKENLETAMIPVIFLSGKLGEEEIRKGIELGAIDYLTKPIDSSKLISAIDVVFNEQ